MLVSQTKVVSVVFLCIVYSSAVTMPGVKAILIFFRVLFLCAKLYTLGIDFPYPLPTHPGASF